MSYQPSLIEDTAFRSERLVYRAPDKERDAPLRNRIANNPKSDSMIESTTQVPENLETTTASLIPKNGIVTLVACLPDVNDQKLPGEAIGFVNLFGSSSGQPHRKANFSIIFDEPYQGQGYGTESLNFLCKIGFMYAGLHKIQGNYVALNKTAGKCYEKVGFKAEGRDREAWWHNGGWTDLIEVGILDREWRALNGF